MWVTQSVFEELSHNTIWITPSTGPVVYFQDPVLFYAMAQLERLKRTLVALTHHLWNSIQNLLWHHCLSPCVIKRHSYQTVYQSWIQISESHFTSHDVISSLHITALVPICRELLNITTQLFLWSWDIDQNSFRLWHSCKLEEPCVICTGQQI